MVTVGGAPEAIGRDHGRRLGARIRMLEDRYVKAIFGDASRHAAGLVAAAGFRPLLRPHHRAEIDALAEAAGVPAGRMLLANSFLDLLPSVGCATIALPDAMPYAILYRTILEECRTVDEAIALLEKEKRQTANNLMLMDASGGRAVVEITPAGIRIRRARDTAPLVATNHHREDGGEPDVCTRYDCLARDAARAWGRFDRTTLQKLLARTGQGDLTLQSMIFEPRDRRLLLAVGKRAAGRAFHALDLGPLLAPPTP